MKRIIICALIAMLALTGCVPLEYASVPADQPTAAPVEAPAATESPAATAEATAVPTQAPATPAPTPKATEKLTPKPTATPKASASPEASVAPGATLSPAPAAETEPTALKPIRREAFTTMRTIGLPPVSSEPARMARAFRCDEGEAQAVDGAALQAELDKLALPLGLLPIYEKGDVVEVSYHAVEALPIGGRSREAAVFLLDYNMGRNVTLLLFFREEGGWTLADAFSTDGMSGFHTSLPNYIYDYGPEGIALNDGTFLLYSTDMKNAWVVVRSCGHGTGYFAISERWYNLHTAETEISLTLQLQESVGFGTAEFAQGTVQPFDLSMMKVYEHISHVTGNPWAGAPEDHTGVWTRRYTFNQATFRMEPDWERYDEGVSMVYAMSVFDGPKEQAAPGAEG